LIYKGRFARVLQEVEIEIDIERGPIQVEPVLEFDVQNICNGCVFEPRKLVVR